MSGYKKPIKRKNGSHPEIWIDGNGDFHYSVPALLDVFGLPHDEEHQRQVEGILERFLMDNFPTASIIHLYHCPGCGVTGKEPHGESCPYIRRMGDEPAPRMALPENNGKHQQNNGAK